MYPWEVEWPAAVCDDLARLQGTTGSLKVETVTESTEEDWR